MLEIRGRISFLERIRRIRVETGRFPLDGRVLVLGFLLVFTDGGADADLMLGLLHVIVGKGHDVLREEQLVKQGVLRLGLREKLIIDVGAARRVNSDEIRLARIFN